MTILNVRDANTGDFVAVNLENPSGILYVNDYNTGELVPIVIGAGATTFDGMLKAWTESKAYEMLSISYDATYLSIITTATVKWPDESLGVLTINSFDPVKLIETSYSITHVNSGKTVIQDAVTLNGYGFVTTKPALRVV